MIKNYFKVALRNFRKHKGYFLINIMGLALGVACCVFISLWVADELSYDRYHEKADQIFRIGAHGVVQKNVSDLATACAPMAKTLIKEYPEVETAGRVRKFGNWNVKYEDKLFKEERVFFADQEMFDVFTIPMIKGNVKDALTQPNTLVLTLAMAQKYFGNENPLGKNLNLGRLGDFKITGVVENVPQNSHIHYDFLASMETISDSRNQNFVSSNYHTYFVLKKGTSVAAFSEKVQGLIKKFIGPQIKGILGISLDKFYASGGEWEYIIQPLTDIHLTSHLRFEHEPNGNITYIFVFLIIAIAVLLIACINFVNLATARSINRAREVGVRKAIGSTRFELMKQFITEAFFMCLLAIGLAVICVKALLPAFNSFTGKSLDLPLFTNPLLIPGFIGAALLIGFLAGLYPSFFLSSFNPVEVLKGKSNQRKGSGKIRNILVVFQFAVSIVLIIGTMVVSGQMKFIQNMNLGFDRHQIVLLPLSGEIQNKVWDLKEELSKNPNIHNTTVTSNLMGTSFGDLLCRPVGLKDQENKLIWNMFADKDFLETYKIKLFSGRYFMDNTTMDKQSVVINETAARLIGFPDPIGQKLQGGNNLQFTIVGVVKDFHFESLQKQIKPLIIMPRGPGMGSSPNLSIRIKSENLQSSIASIKTVWNKLGGGQSFNYRFFDDHFAKIYLKEQKTGQIFLVFTVMAIFIACLGLFALSSFVINQSTKEIGIRKVLGATVPDIYLSLVMRFTKWGLIANLIAWPVAYLAMSTWLKNFAYQTELGLVTFVIAGVSTMIISILTVLFQSIRAATANPVKSLRYE